MAGGVRILAVTHTLQYDGAPQSMLQITRALSREGFEIMLLSGRRGPLLREYEEIGAEVVSPQLPFIPTEVWNPYYPKTYAQHFSELVALIRRHEPEIVFANTLQTHWAIHAAALIGKPSVWSIRESINDLSELSAARRMAVSLASRVVFCSDETRRVYAPLDRGQFETVYNGIDLAIVERHRKRLRGRDLRRDLGLPPTGAVISVIGTPAARKGHHVLVEAAGELALEFPEVHFLFVGVPDTETDYIHRLRERIDALGLAGRFTLARRTENVFPYIAVSDIVAVPSYNESFPRVTLEAMAFARPIVAFDAWGIREQLEHGRHALIVPQGDREKLAEALRRLLTHPGEAAEMAERARERLAAEFTVERMTGPYVELFKKLAGDGRAAAIAESEAVAGIREALRGGGGTRAGLRRARAGLRAIEPGSAEILRVLELVREWMTDSAAYAKDLQDEYPAFLVRILKENPGLRLAGAQGILDGLELSGGSFRELNLENISVEDAIVGGSEFDRISLNKAIFRNLTAPRSQWLESGATLAQFFTCELDSAAFSSCALNGAAFFGTRLIRASFEQCELRRAYFRDCLIGAGIFRGSDLGGAIFHRCHLERAVFDDCDLERASFIDCVFDGATSEAVRDLAACRNPAFAVELIWKTTVRARKGA